MQAAIMAMTHQGRLGGHYRRRRHGEHDARALSLARCAQWHAHGRQAVVDPMMATADRCLRGQCHGGFRRYDCGGISVQPRTAVCRAGVHPPRESRSMAASSTARLRRSRSPPARARWWLTKMRARKTPAEKAALRPAFLQRRHRDGGKCKLHHDGASATVLMRRMQARRHKIPMRLSPMAHKRS